MLSACSAPQVFSAFSAPQVLKAQAILQTCTSNAAHFHRRAACKVAYKQNKMSLAYPPGLKVVNFMQAFTVSGHGELDASNCENTYNQDFFGVTSYSPHPPWQALITVRKLKALMQRSSYVTVSGQLGLYASKTL